MSERKRSTRVRETESTLHGSCITSLSFLTQFQDKQNRHMQYILIEGPLSITSSTDTSKVITSQPPVEEARMWKIVKQNLSLWVCSLLDTEEKTVAVADIL